MSDFLHKKTKQVKGFRAGDATHIKELFHPKNDNIDLPYSLAWGDIEIGASSLPHILQNDELYYILEGEGIIHVEQQSIEVSGGDSLLVYKNKEQYVENIGQGKLKFLCIVSPPWEDEKEEILIKK